MLFVINYLAVFVYGLLIMVFLLDIRINKENAIALTTYTILALLSHTLIFYLLGDHFLEMAYPVVVHFPLLLFFCVYYKKRFDGVLFVLCTSYILTTPRRWIGNVVALAFQNDPKIAAYVQILVTLPLLYLIYKYLRPYIIRIMSYSGIKIRFLLILPLIYYIIAYLTTVYTQLLYNSRVIAIGLLTTGLVFTFSYFIVVYFNELVKRFEIEKQQDILAVQVSGLQTRTEAIKLAEENAMFLRHDLRHHLQLINSFLMNDQIKKAQTYLAEIEENMYHNVFIQYCQNEAANLILSSYINMAKSESITITIQVEIPAICKIADMDLCVIFANAIENAIHALKAIPNTNDRLLIISCKTKGDQLLIQIINRFDGNVSFINEMPVTDTEKHGFGSKSIAATVQKYKGICSFRAEDSLFYVNVIL